MRRVPLPTPTALTAAILLVAATTGTRARAEEAYELRYRFTEGATSTYALHVELDVSTSAKRGAEEQESSADTKLDLLMQVVEHEPKESTRAKPTLAVTFRDLVVSQKLKGPEGDIAVTIRGEKVKVERGFSVVIDTEKGEGKDLAKGLLKEFAFLGKEGTLTVEPDGRVSAVDGPSEFRSFVAPGSGAAGGSGSGGEALTGAGLWVLQTAGEPVRIGESWQSSGRKIERLRGLDLSENPLVVKLGYALKEVAEEGGRKIARVAVKSANLARDLSGKVSNESLTAAPVTIRTFERTVKGTVRFDVESGRLVESDLSVKLNVTVEMKVGDGETDGEEIVKTTISGTARVQLKLQAPEETEEKAAERAAPKAAPKAE